jgi:ATP-dependent Clp protease ATP-binding subunit ClpA
MQNNPEIEKIVNNAVAIAKAHNHAYVITEHVLMAMIQHAPFRSVLTKYGTAVEQFEGELVHTS